MPGPPQKLAAVPIAENRQCVFLAGSNSDGTVTRYSKVVMGEKKDGKTKTVPQKQTLIHPLPLWWPNDPTKPFRHYILFHLASADVPLVFGTFEALEKCHGPRTIMARRPLGL